MGPLVQELVLRGEAKLYEKTIFVAAGDTGEMTVDPPANYVYIVYEIDLEPHDINLYLSITGPNIVGGANLRSLGQPIETAYLAVAGTPLELTLNNNTDSAGVCTARWFSLTSLKYRQLLNASYDATNAGWMHTLKRADQLPGHVTEGGHNNG